MGTYRDKCEIEDDPDDIEFPADIGDTSRCDLYNNVVRDPKEESGMRVRHR